MATETQTKRDPKTETWFAKIVYAGNIKEQVFSCDGTIAAALRQSMMEGKNTAVTFENTELLLNPAHVARIELQLQTES